MITKRLRFGELIIKGGREFHNLVEEGRNIKFIQVCSAL